MSKTTLSLLGLMALSVVWAPPADTQERRPVRGRVWVDDDSVDPFDLITRRRARLGMVVDMRAVENDSIGATIASVTPGGPAAEAGIRSGDIVTRLNGRSLVRTDRDRDADAGESLAALELVEMAARLEPGDTVTVEFRRGDDRRTVTVVTARERDLARGSFFVWPDRNGDGPTVRSLPRITGGGEVLFRFGGPMANIELAPLNDDLGSYFGTSEGVLVIDAPADNPFGLKGGDVVLSVDGREARSPSSLLRILGSYEDGEAVKLEIMRNRSRQTISSRIERE